MARALILLSAIATAAASPAIVWKNGATSPQHSSETIGASSLLEAHSSSSLDLVFVLSRDKDGSEALSTLASSGKLSRTQAKYETAHSIHHHVSGVESSKSVARDLAAGGREVAQLSLSQLEGLLSSSEEDFPAAVVVTASKTEASALDEAVSGAVAHAKVGSVVLTAQRSVDEVKRDRALIVKRNKVARKQKKIIVDSPRRRLEDADDDQNDDGNQQQQDEEQDADGVYYVNMTPNILAGILFTLMFVFVVQLGLNCMNQISFSDIYVTKCPAVGREA